MERQRTLGQYRALDLTIFGGMQVLFEFLILTAGRFWFPGQPFTVSLAGALTSIVYMRWGWWGAFQAALAGAVYCFFQGASFNQYLIYCIGNLFSLAAVFVLLKVGKEKVRTGSLGLIFPIMVLLFMQTGRAVVALILGAAPSGIAGFFTTDSLSMLFTFVIIWIAKRLDGIYEDQKHYLLRIHAKEE